MNTYFAGAPGMESRERGWQRLIKHRLLSFWNIVNDEFSVPFAFKLIKSKMNIVDKRVDLFLDSGAYSAETQGVKIDIQEYIKFIKENENVIEIYANLDVIGDAKGTFRNHKIMEEAGLNPLPVFHAGEDEKYLKYYLDHYEYLCLGGMVGSSTGALTHWLDRTFPMTCDEHGMPKIKVHGFGLTSLTLMMRYPWYSVDSTSWVLTGRLGSIFIPRWKGDKWIYDENSWKIAVSNKSPGMKETGKHISTCTKGEQEIFMRYITEKGYKLGSSRFEYVSPTHEPTENERWAERKEKNQTKRLIELIDVVGLSNRYQLRDEMNIIYFLDLEKEMTPWPWPFKQQSAEGFGL